MRLLCLSDMHGELRHYESPAHNAHVAVIAGDVTPATHAYYGGKPSGLSGSGGEITGIGELAGDDAEHSIKSLVSGSREGANPGAKCGTSRAIATG